MTRILPGERKWGRRGGALSPPLPVARLRWRCCCCARATPSARSPSHDCTSDGLVHRLAGRSLDDARGERTKVTDMRGARLAKCSRVDSKGPGRRNDPATNEKWVNEGQARVAMLRRGPPM